MRGILQIAVNAGHSQNYSRSGLATRLNILIRKFTVHRLFELAFAAAILSACCIAQTAPLVFDFVPSQTTISFTLGDTLHTVHGAFDLKRGRLSFNPGTGEATGELAVDASSGRTGNGMRDRKMHKEIVESAKYPEIIFRPDRVDGRVAMNGSSTVQVHGIFTIHGSDHELTIPVQVEMSRDGIWTATGHFLVPYVKWGMKNPSTFILRVSESVEIEVRSSGKNSQISQ